MPGTFPDETATEFAGGFMACINHSFAATGIVLLLAALSTPADATLHNPVARCADSGVFRWNGQYVITGVGLPGRMLVSRDLVYWDGPVTP